MTAGRRGGTPGGPRLRPGAVFVVLLALLIPAALRAQDPVPPDTLAPDTVVVADTLGIDTLAVPPQDTVAPDTAPPLPLVPLPDVPPDTGWAAGVWEWDRAALLASTALTLGDLLERVPSAVVYRSGFLGMPEGLSLLGMNAGRVDVLLDGYVLDPLAAGALDLSRIELVTLERVRVVRRMDGARVELTSASPTSHRPYSRVEAATGYFDTEIFRGLFLAPRFLFGPLGLGIERVETDGLRSREGANRLTLWGTWALTRERWGVQLEGRRSTLEREEGAPLAGELRRSDLVLRGRAEPTAGLVLEAYAGTSSLAPELPEDTLPDEGGESPPPDPEEPGATLPLPDSISRTAVDGRQVGVRAALRRGPLWARGAVRHRDADGLPGLAAELAAGGRVAGMLELHGGLDWADWDAESAAGWDVRAVAGPFRGVRLVGEYGSGTRGVPFSGDSLLGVRVGERTAWRVGAEVTLPWAQVSGGYVSLSTDSVPGLGLEFDPRADFYDGWVGEDDAVTGWEVTGRVRLFWEPLSVRGWFNAFEGRIWPYLPGRSWNTALVYDHRPLTSGNLQVHARLEQQHRGAVWGRNIEAPGESEEFVPEAALLPVLDVVNFHLQLRILDVWAFLRWENILNAQGDIVAGRPILPQRTFYGVKWQFWN